MRTFQPAPLAWPEAGVTTILHLKPLMPTVRITRDLRGWTRPDPCILVQMVDSKAEGVVLTTRLRMEIRGGGIDQLNSTLADLRRHMISMRSALPDCTRSEEWLGARLMPDTDESEMIVVAFDVSFRGEN